MKPLFANNPSLNTRMMLALLASLVLFFLDSRLDYFKPVRSVLSTVVYPIQVTASMPTSLVDWIEDFFQDREQLREKMAVLEASNMLQNIRLQKMQALERENMRLRELLGSSFRLQERVQVAELLTVDLDPFSQQVVIDKGKNYGVYVGQPVLDAKGVMGQVTETSPLSSRVVLLTDPSHSIPVQINRNGLRAVVTGRGLGEKLQMDFLPHNADIRVGDLLVTSGLGGRFPVGYPVGEVIAVDFPQGKAFADIKVEPAANLATSREVMLVLPGEKIQAEPVAIEEPEASENAVEVPQEEQVNGDNS
ncbi:rod shape-determining protein MreC [Methylophaga thiooxydans]|uniref:rod shape-determining protein MreC n=1 Tax=Methylophaga thiooxydans TaxID=392484 RepID=UPI0023571066|nr:rod shape-determining protein MreC [Methylophaga thiooxydans]